MALFRQGLPRRAVVGAFLGFLFGALYMPTGGAREFIIGGVWITLAVSLLFGRPFSYYTYVAWSLLWMAWRGVLTFQGNVQALPGVIEVLVPLVSVALLSSSGYLEAVKTPRSN